MWLTLVAASLLASSSPGAYAKCSCTAPFAWGYDSLLSHNCLPFFLIVFLANFKTNCFGFRNI